MYIYEGKFTNGGNSKSLHERGLLIPAVLPGRHRTLEGFVDRSIHRMCACTGARRGSAQTWSAGQSLGPHPGQIGRLGLGKGVVVGLGDGHRPSHSQSQADKQSRERTHRSTCDVPSLCCWSGGMHPRGWDIGVSGCACPSTAGPDPRPFLAATEVTALTIGPVQAEPVVVASDAKRQRLERTCRSPGVFRGGSLALVVAASPPLIPARLRLSRRCCFSFRHVKNGQEYSKSSAES